MSLPISRKRTRKNNSRGVRALERGLAILLVLAKESEMSLSAIANHVGLSNSTTFRLLKTLKETGFVAQSEERGLYRVGIRAFEVGEGFLTRLPVHELSLPEMRRLMEEANETVNLAIRNGREAVYVAQVEGRQMMRTFTQIGMRVPLYCTGVGKVLIAWLPQEEVASLLGRGKLVAYTENTITNVDDLCEELESIRRLGYGLDREERENGVRCIAAPIRDRHGKVVAALSISGPASRLDDTRLPLLASRVIEVADSISGRLGYLV